MGYGIRPELGGGKMNEAYVKQQLSKRLLEKELIHCYRFEDMFRRGIPDMLLARNKRAMWLEVKYSDYPNLPWKWTAYKADQSEACRRLTVYSGIPVYYFCRNSDGLFSISTIESVVECLHQKVSLETHRGSVQGIASAQLSCISQLLNGEVVLNHA
jgi:hypothetical protein